MAIALPTSAGLTAIDGPFHFGDLVALGIFGVAAGLQASGIIPSVQEIDAVVSDVKVAEKTEKASEQEERVYRKVKRMPDGLQYIGSDYLTATEAYKYVSIGGDVWCKTEYEAEIVAAKSEIGYFLEIDGGDNPNPDYFYHFHFGQKYPRYTVGGHVFYDASPSGKLPY